VSSRAKPRPSPSIAIALGGGGARGLAHIVALEALDELGVRPALIAGTSMGAVIGAAYASGMPAKALRCYVLDTLRDRAQVLARLLQARIGRLSDLVRGLGNPVLIDGEKFLDLFWPEAVPDRFEDLTLPFVAIATDYYGRCEAVLGSGPLVTAVAGSMAIPGLIRPVEAGGRVLVDGGAVNPLPFDHLVGKADIIVAVDVSGGPALEGRGLPDGFEAMFGAAQIMQNAIVAEKLKARGPDVLIRPVVEGFRALDFFKAKAILNGAELAKEEMKRALDAALAAPRLSAWRERTP
jgi:NTE family protein